MNHRSTLRLFLSTLFLAAINGCDAKSTSPSTQSESPGTPISVEPSRMTLDEGESAPLRVFELAPSGEPGREVTIQEWESSDRGVAQVESGRVTAARLGTSLITVTAGGQTATVEVEVVRRPQTLTVLSGFGQSAVVGNELPQPIAVRITSNLGRPVSGAVVGFAVLEGGGRTSSTDVATDGDGIARSAWVLGPIAGEQRVDVRVPSAPSLDTLVWAVAYPGAMQEFSVQPETFSIVPGSSIQLEVYARDAYGNRVEDLPVVWSVADPAIAAVGGGGLLEGLQAGTTEVTATLSPAYLSAHAAGGIQATKASSRAEIGARASYSVSFEGDGQPGVVGEPLGSALRVKVIQSDGKPAASYQVEWVVTSGDGTVTAARTTSDPDGAAVVDWTLGPTAGVQGVQARIQLDGVTPLDFSATALPGPVEVVEVHPSRVALKPGETIQLSARATDRFGNQRPARFSFEVGDPATASTTSSGLVQGLGSGLTGVSATTEGISAIAELEVIGTDSGNRSSPVVAVTSPSPDTSLSGPVMLHAAAAGRNAVSAVTFQVDGENVGADATAPYELEWNSSEVVDGSHAITATVLDVAGNLTTSDPVVVQVTESLVTEAALITDPSSTIGNGLLLWYHFDRTSEESSTLVKDFSGNGRNATCSGSSCPASATGRYGNAARFDGTDDMFTVGTWPASASGSVAFWFKADRTTTLQRLLGSTDAYEVVIDRERLGNQLYAAGSDYLGAGTLSPGAWYHAVLTYNHSTRRQEIWLNGQRIGGNYDANDVAPTGTLTIGKRPGVSGIYDGLMDELAIWNRVLTQSEIQSIYTSPPPGSFSETTSTSTNTPPVASFSSSCLLLVCTFTDASTDAGGQITARAWTFGDGGTSTATNPVRTFLSANTYTVTLKVKDDKGATGTVSKQIQVFASASGTWNRVLADQVIDGDVVVPDGQKWLIGRNVQIRGNLRTVGGTIAMRPGSSLKFLGADPARYVGGGMTYSDALARDIGLWVGPQGTLDIQCTPKTGWNRTGVDPSWKSTDEYWITPTAAGDFKPRRWYPGQSVPRVDSRVPAAEVLNVTRDCVIEGPAHIHIHSTRAQRIEYVRLQNMGVGYRTDGSGIIGRYALHMHMSGNGTRGTIVRGVASVGARSKVFVPHASHGITMIDNVSVNSFQEGLWWDIGHDTNDLLVDRLAVVGVNTPRDMTGRTNRFDGYTLGSGLNTEVRNSVASGVWGEKLTVGFNWVSGGQAPNPVWKFDAGNVAHNNEGPGLRFWTNGDHAHVVANYASYRNGIAGIESGAYLNGVEYHDVTIFQDGHSNASGQHSGVLWHVNSRLNTSGRPAQMTNATIISAMGPAVFVGDRQLQAGSNRSMFTDCSLSAPSGQPKVFVSAGGSLTKPWRAHFLRCDVTPNDIVIASSSRNEGTEILLDHKDGRKWRVQFLKGKKVVTTR
jgi:PKD repeat protein